MNLRVLAESDLRATLEDVDHGFAWAIELRDPDGKKHGLAGLSGDIGAVIDPTTGMPVAGRAAHVSLRISSIKAAGFTELPRRVDLDGNPWRVKFLDLAGDEHSFVVQDAKPDRTLGMLTLMLEAYAD